jgi:DNA-binding NarL/FixJ family response regulator
MLTKRQKQILTMFCSGRTGRQIAEELGLSPETINPSLKQSARRLGAPGIARATLTRYATEAGEFP